MTGASREFQVFAKPAGAACNLDCRYCYYLEKQNLYPHGRVLPHARRVLEEYIVQHIEACPDPVIPFLLARRRADHPRAGLLPQDRELQRKHQPAGRRIVNGIQTNGTLLDEDWCRFLAAEGFAVGLSLDGPQELHDRYRVTKDGRSPPTSRRCAATGSCSSTRSPATSCAW